MKSPTSSVGRIDELGILNGSAMKERNRNTMRRTGKKLFGYSTHHGSGASGGRFLAKYRRSARATAPVATVSRNRMSAKFIGKGTASAGEGQRVSFFSDLENGEEGFLGDLDAADRLHALLARLLLLEELALARDVSAVALRQNVLAQRLHRFAR